MLGVIVDFPFRPGHWIFLPLLFRLYLNRKSAAWHRCVYRTRPELGVEMLRILCVAHENRHFHVVADSAYGGQNVLANLPNNCDLTSRLLLASRLYDAAPERIPGTNGGPRKRGLRRPSPEDMLESRCRRVSLSIYGRSYHSRIADQVARVFAVPDRPLRIVASEAMERRSHRGRPFTVGIPARQTRRSSTCSGRWVTGGGAHAPGAGLWEQAQPGWRSAADMQ